MQFKTDPTLNTK